MQLTLASQKLKSIKALASLAILGDLILDSSAPATSTSSPITTASAPISRTKKVYYPSSVTNYDLNKVISTCLFIISLALSMVKPDLDVLQQLILKKKRLLVKP